MAPFLLLCDIWNMFKHALKLQALSHGMFGPDTKERNVYKSAILYIRLNFSRLVHMDAFYKIFFLLKISNFILNFAL